MAKKETSVEKKKVEALAIPTELQGAWGTENADSKDILVPRVHLAQSMSDVAQSGTVRPGQFYRSTNGEVIGDASKPLEVFILSSFKTWTVEKKKGEKYEWHQTVPYNPQDANLPWDFEENGEKFRRNETANFYVLLAEDLKKTQSAREAFEKGEIPDEVGELLPAVLSFRRTSYVCAKAITNYMLHMKTFKQPACTYVLEFRSEMKDNDLGKFFVPQMKKGRKATVEEIKTCHEWYQMLAQTTVKIDEEVKTSEESFDSNNAQF